MTSSAHEPDGSAATTDLGRARLPRRNASEGGFPLRRLSPATAARSAAAARIANEPASPEPPALDRAESTLAALPAPAPPGDAAGGRAVVRAAESPVTGRSPAKDGGLSGGRTVPDDRTLDAALDRLFQDAGPGTDGTVVIPRLTAAVDGGRHRRHHAARRPAIGLPALLIFALAAAFFGWVSATPLWLTVGHGRAGTATVGSCTVHGIARQCADFVASDHSFTREVTLLGPPAGHATAGQKIEARMVSRESSLAYVGDASDLYLRWVPGVIALLLCGLGIAWATGARRLAGRRAKALALIGSFGGPLLLLAGMLAYAW